MGFWDFFKPLRKLLAPFEFIGKKVAIGVNYVLLTLIYITAVALTWLVAKIFGKKFLHLKTEPGKQSYWLDRKKEDYASKESYRQF
jgi:hypothetical protein